MVPVRLAPGLGVTLRGSLWCGHVVPCWAWVVGAGVVDLVGVGGSRCGRWFVWCPVGVLSEEFAVPEGGPARSVEVLMVLAYLYDDSCAVPFSRVVADLVLDPDTVPDFELRQGQSVFTPGFLLGHVAFPECRLSEVQ